MTFRVTVTSDGTAFNLTGYTAKMYIKKGYEETEVLKEIDGVISTPANGIITVTLATTDTDIDPADYVYEIKIYTALYAEVKTVVQGELKVEKVLKQLE